MPLNVYQDTIRTEVKRRRDTSTKLKITVLTRRQGKAKRARITVTRLTIRRGTKLMVSTMSITRTNTRRKRTSTTMTTRRVISANTRNSTKVTRSTRVILRKEDIILLRMIIRIAERKDITIRDTM